MRNAFKPELYECTQQLVKGQSKITWSVNEQNIITIYQYLMLILSRNTESAVWNVQQNVTRAINNINGLISWDFKIPPTANEDDEWSLSLAGKTMLACSGNGNIWIGFSCIWIKAMINKVNVNTS